MEMSPLLERLGFMIEAATTLEELWVVMLEITLQLGFQYFALIHHVDFPRLAGKTFRLHNYPKAWAVYFEENRTAARDPIHRASYMTNTGFPWSEAKSLVPITTSDTLHMTRAYTFGIEDGFTVPANIPGETRGSCTFAVGNGRPLPYRAFPAAQWLGSKAFRRAREILRLRDFGTTPPVLSERQLECLLLLAQGKTAEEIARILGRGKETVITQLKKARELYGVYEKTSLVTHALNNGTLCLGEVIR
jgi:LuxR family quorum-sensing system transcriptional regulator CciR